MDLNSKIKKAIDLLNEKKLRIAFAESVTGGFLSYKYSITECSGGVFLGSMVCYNPELKQKILQVDPELIEQYSAESKEVTEKMLDGLMHIIHPDIGIAVTGLCSPGGSESEEKPVGTVFAAISYNLKTYHFKYENDGPPENIVSKAVEKITDSLTDLLEGKLN